MHPPQLSHPQYHRVPDRGNCFINSEGKICPTVSLGNELREGMGMGPRTSNGRSTMVDLGPRSMP